MTLDEVEEDVTISVGIAHVPDWGPGDEDYVRDLCQFEEELKKQDCPDGVVFKVVNKLGLAALRPEPWESEQEWQFLWEAEAHHLQSIRTLLWQRVERWYKAARSARTVTERARAARALERFGRTLAGDRRGKRKATVTEPGEVRLTYYRYLARLQRARTLLKERRSPGTLLERLTAAAEACRIPPNRFRLSLNVDEEGRPSTKPQPIEAEARSLTASEYGITEQTVSNILSSGPRLRSLK